MTALVDSFLNPPRDDVLRRRLSEEAEKLGVAALHERLRKIDPAGAARLHPNDLRRVIRASRAVKVELNICGHI